MTIVSASGSRASNAVAEQPGNLFDGYAGVRQDRHEAVAQLAGGPGLGVEPGRAQDNAEGATNVVGVHLGAVGRGEHE
jgi:hypothetical protein